MGSPSQVLIQLRIFFMTIFEHLHMIVNLLLTRELHVSLHVQDRGIPLTFLCDNTPSPGMCEHM